MHRADSPSGCTAIATEAISACKPAAAKGDCMGFALLAPWMMVAESSCTGSCSACHLQGAASVLGAEGPCLAPTSRTPAWWEDACLVVSQGGSCRARTVGLQAVKSTHLAQPRSRKQLPPRLHACCLPWLHGNRCRRTSDHCHCSTPAAAAMQVGGLPPLEQQNSQ